VFVPLIAPRVKESLDPARKGVNSTQVRAFIEVAAVARQREIIGVV
jgi:hypothetical protein